MAIFALRLNNLSAAGQAQKGVECPDLYIFSLGHLCIAPYEQFISGWPSHAQMARYLHFELGLPFLHRTI